MQAPLETAVRTAGRANTTLPVHHVSDSPPLIPCAIGQSHSCLLHCAPQNPDGKGYGHQMAKTCLHRQLSCESAFSKGLLTRATLLDDEC